MRGDPSGPGAVLGVRCAISHRAHCEPRRRPQRAHCAMCCHGRHGILVHSRVVGKDGPPNGHEAARMPMLAKSQAPPRRPTRHEIFSVASWAAKRRLALGPKAARCSGHAVNRKSHRMLAAMASHRAEASCATTPASGKAMPAVTTTKAIPLLSRRPFSDCVQALFSLFFSSSRRPASKELSLHQTRSPRIRGRIILHLRTCHGLPCSCPSSPVRSSRQGFLP